MRAMNPGRLAHAGRRCRVAAAKLAMLAAALVAAAGALAAATEADMSSTSSAASVHGVATLEGTTATVPAGATFEASLEDVSRADAPAILLGRISQPVASAPIRFEIAFDPSRIAPAHTYAVRARIVADSRLSWTSDQVHRVLTHGAGHSVELVLKRVGGTATTGGGKRGGAVPAHGLQLPATFRGDLPCADCAGVRHHLDLWPDQVFHLRREWLGKNHVRDEIGRWRVDPARRALLLQGGGEMPLQFEIEGARTLRQLDLAGKPIESTLPYQLTSEGRLDTVDVALFLGGEVTRLADALRFTECLTGRSYPVAPGSEAHRLEQAYFAQAREPGAPLYVTFDGSIETVPVMEQGRDAATVKVARFIGAWPNQDCERSRADASLVNTYWRLVQMQGAAVTAVPGRREPHLILKAVAAESNYAATAGCNQLVGGFELDGDALTFERAASTPMACPPPLAEMERQLQQTLEQARRWQRRGNVLVLEDQQGASLSLLEAVYF